MSVIVENLEDTEVGKQLRIYEGNVYVGALEAYCLSTRVVYLADFSIFQDHRGKGFGAKAIKDTIEHFVSDSFHSVELDCYGSVTGFYEKLGFTKMYEHPRMFGDSDYGGFFRMVLHK